MKADKLKAKQQNSGRGQLQMNGDMAKGNYTVEQTVRQSGETEVRIGQVINASEESGEH